MFKGQEFLDRQLQVGVLLILFFSLLKMLSRVFFIMFLYYNFDIIHTAEWNFAIIFVYNFVVYFIVFKMFIDELEEYFP